MQIREAASMPVFDPTTDAALAWLNRLVADWLSPHLTLTTQTSKTGAREWVFSAKGPGALVLPLQDLNPASGTVLWDGDGDIHGAGDICATRLPAPFADTLPAPLITQRGSKYWLDYDVISMSCWTLWRMEEMNPAVALDIHERFPVTAAHAYQNDYLDRPIVDEWWSVLRRLCQKIWQSIDFAKPEFKQTLTHDVDRPLRYGFSTPKALVRSVGGDVLKRKHLGAAMVSPLINIRSQKRLLAADPYNQFDFIMDASERIGTASDFYFICGGDHPRDAGYTLDTPSIRALMRRIHERGHVIGIHPSFDCVKIPGQIKREADTLRRVMAEENITQDGIGGRMHYLRWRHPDTLHEWVAAELSYDATMTFAAKAGFRCGTARDYRAFDGGKDVALPLIIAPTAVMEQTIFGTAYENLSGDAAHERFILLKSRCQKVGGTFRMLWHNSLLETPAHRQLYQDIIAA